MHRFRNLYAWMGALLCGLSILTSACRVQVAQAPEEPTMTRPRIATPDRSKPTANATSPVAPPASTPEIAPSPASNAAPNTDIEVARHTVQPGDTLLGIASTHDVPMAAIQLQNHMGSSTVVQVGQNLEIPSRSAWEGASRFWIVHAVAEGETLSSIAKAYGLTIQAIQQTNGLTDADLIVAGQALILPLEAPAAAQAKEPPATATPQPEPTPIPISATAPVTTTNITTDTNAGLNAGPTAGPTAPTSTARPAAPAPPPPDVAAWPRETVRLINVVREQHGLPPLIYNETLAQAAQGQANDCAQRDWCSHTGSDGSNIKARILRAGYDPASWAECWAQRKTPQGAVDIWMDEVPPNDPHRRTLLTTWLSEIGVGIAETDWGYYFIADFGRPE